MENEKNNFLWKYLSLDKFISLLENEAFYLPSLKKLQLSMDPMEGATSKRLINYTLNEMDKYKEFFPKKVFDLKNFTHQLTDTPLNYSYIFSCSSAFDENYALWNIYPTDIFGNLQRNQGIGLKINENYFKKKFENKNIKIKNNIKNFGIAKAILKDVIYKTKDEIDTLINSNERISHEDFKKIFEETLLIKNDFYDFAKEKRYIVSLNYDAKEINNCSYSDSISNIWVCFDIQELFKPENCKIIISPFAHTSLIQYIKYLLLQKEIKGVDNIVINSKIATT